MKNPTRIAAAVIVGLALVLSSCAPYKELKPKPELVPAEGTYIPLKRGDKDFELKQGEKYFMAFPGPQEDNFYLILNSPDKKKVTSFFTAKLVDGKKPGQKIADETPRPDTQSVYPINISSPMYYWIVENVPQDVVIRVQYRYAPRWRFKFETRYTDLRETFGKNLVDRTTYKAIAPGYSIDGMDFALAIDTVGKHTTVLEGVHTELLSIESLFPQKLLNSQDPAYKNFTTFKAELEDELKFQRAYRMTLEYFYREQQTRKNPLEFLTRVEDFIGFFQKKAEVTEGVLQLAQQVLKRRLAEVGPYYDQKLGAKTDATPLDEDSYRLKGYNRIPALSEAAGLGVPADFTAQHKFVNEFDTKARLVAATRDSLAGIAAYIKKSPSMPGDPFFGPVVARARAVQSALPQPLDQGNGKYLSLPCSGKLNEAIAAVTADVNKIVEQYRLAESLVPQLNALKAQREYSEMLAVLKANPQLGFLWDKYRELDKMSIDEQARRVRESLTTASWASAENGLRKLHADQNFLDPASLPQKAAVVADLEDTLYIRVERVTRSRVMKFLDEHVNTLTNIDTLYTDSAFLPVHEITFSSGGKRELVQRKEQLVADLAKMKENEFPMRAVKLMYEQFLKNPIDSGVYRARAIVAHGKHYTGDDKDTKIRIAECDPTLAKWITKPTEYRRVFALPLTDNERKGVKNKYMFRLNVRVPTEAQFPVYDVNVKLPKEIAENAASEQWYDKMLLNRKELKNEGRFSITAPTSANNYECQATPVQMDKEGNNIFEVTFYYPAFKVFPVSVMVQKPIIKKN